MAGRKTKFTISNQYKLIIFLFIPLLLLPVYVSFVDVFGVFIARLLFLAIIFWIGHRLFKKTRSILYIKEKRSQFYKRFIKPVIAKVPAVVWGGFAVFGIFLFGFLVGLAAGEEGDVQEYAKEDKQAVEYRGVIHAYQDLSRLFYLQGQDMDIITNYPSWESDPQELADAISSYKQKKEEILFQLGILYEKRQRANLPEDPYTKTD